MFITVQAHQFSAYSHLLDQYFKLRKKVFADHLGWAVPVEDGKETDRYDRLKPVYLLWCDENLQTLFGGVRFMPTTGPTLLYDVFRKTFPNAVELRAPGIWEATRLCIDEDAIQQHELKITAARAFSLMILALSECGLEHGIHTLISNYEPQMARVYRRAGACIQELGRADGFGRLPVCCGAFEVTTEVCQFMRETLGVDESFYRTSTQTWFAQPLMLEAA
ncbi:acyl-homoserine-lactone synthase [Rhizobium sp. FKY42]|uniref:acyl-homoserine-lactone synthase n=1 Tax=Rhizobium sp. FKY42 TaxID=2562310 RepID=UPI0010C00759|nr:acyl-homoserine-lactone synthase [Rhizobium sp. FKY42]